MKIRSWILRKTKERLEAELHVAAYEGKFYLDFEFSKQIKRSDIDLIMNELNANGYSVIPNLGVYDTIKITWGE